VAKKKSQVRQKPNSNETPIKVLKEATCSTLSGSDKAQLTYQILSNDAGDIYIKVTGNKGGGFWASENTPYAAIAALIANSDSDERLTAWSLKGLFVGKSSNSPGYLLSVLRAEALVEPLPGKKRQHVACDPADFLANVQRLKAGGGPLKKPARKSKAKPTPKAKAKSPRKSPATKRKAK
jgi:hypothetical protein